jgi:serine phosphatase RsbU (regulator of sigma subunit)/anti-sigma regulatory factor (Ser/Thr protein kinase)
VPVRRDHSLSLPPTAASTGRARAIVRRALVESGLNTEGDDAALVDTVLLLASELCDNAVLHAGTEFEVEVEVRADEVLVTVTDHGAGPLELYLSSPRPRFGRAATHGRGLMLLDRMATAWGTRHGRGGHRTWFSVSRRPGESNPLDGAGPDASSGAIVDPAAGNGVDGVSTSLALPEADQVSRLLRVPAALGARLEMSALVTELIRRLREVVGAEWVGIEVDRGDGSGTSTVAEDGVEPGSGTGVREFPLPLTAPLRGALRIVAGAGAPVNPEIAELTGHRVALAVETDWLREADLRRRAWMAYLADASELLGQTMDTELVVALVPQVVVPRLGEWCAVLLLDEAGRLRLTALTHAADESIPDLRSSLEPPPAELGRQLADILSGSASTAWFSEPTDGIAVALSARSRPIGALVVGRPERRAHTPEDVALVGDIARRASLAIDNARTTAAHIATSQALQQALLPRALPVAPGVEFAAEYLPATTGSDVSGDFYDVLDLDATHWLATIGDVCGKGARAAARTGMVRDVLRVLGREGRTLTRALELLNDVMMDVADPSQFATVAVAMVSRSLEDRPGGLTVDLVLAGHPQPVLVRADGRAELVGEFGTAVGLTRTLRLTATRHHLGEGDTLLAYTDGVTERRVGREQYGSDRLLAAAAQGAGQSAARLVAAVRTSVRAWSTQPRGDDIALLAIRAVPPRPPRT